jgi:hypothetical protein
MAPSSLGDGPAFFREYLDETVGPFAVTIGTTEYELDAPPPVIGDALDEGDSYLDLLELLVDDDDLFDGILDYLEAQPQSVTVAIVEDALDHWGLVNPPRHGFKRVVSEIERYGAAIEFDFQEILNLNMAVFVREPQDWPWSKFMRFVEQLPTGHHYAAALALDVELAEAMARQADEDKKNGIRRPDRRPSLIGWTPEQAALVAIGDGIRRVEHGVWAASPKFKGKGGKAPKPSPRPRVASEVVEARRLRLQHDDIAGKMLGKRFTPSTQRGR